MTTERIQSDIKEVRDQLSLDFADGEYLNLISQNLGMDRPILGFTDDSWRAVVKILALEYKQIANKFRDVLEVIFGPRVTEVGTLASATVAGDAEFVLNDTSNLPQLGTLIFDEGLITEETRPYCYIDRATNTVFLEGSLGAPHSARTFDSEEPIVLVDGAKVVCRKTNNFPITNYPYPVVLGRGTTNEEVVQVTDNNLVSGTLTLSSTPLNSHNTVRVGDIFDQLNQAYFPSSSFLQLEDSTQFPSEGYIKLQASGDATATAFVLTANTPLAADDFVLLAADTFLAAVKAVPDMVFANVAGSSIDIQSVGGNLPSLVVGDRFEVHDANTAANDALYEVTAVTTENEDYTVTSLDGTPADDAVSDPTSSISYDGEVAGYEVVFTGNVTSALAGVTRRIVSGTDSYLSFDDDFTGPAAAPATGDEFTLYPIVQYVSLDYDSHTLTLRAPILETNLTIPLNSTVELMVVAETAALSPVKFVGTGWDIIQTTPRLVELLVPDDIRDDNDLRSSSHIHDDTLATISTTNSVQADPNDTTVTALSFAAFPDAGTVELDPGGGSAERVPFGKAISQVKTYVAEGDTSIFLVNSRSFPATGSVVVDPGLTTEETLAYSANDTVTGELTVSATTEEHRIGDIVKCDTELLLQDVVINTHLIGTTIEFYQPKYGATDIPIGDFNQITDTFPGPYLYSLDEQAPTGTVALTNASSIVPGSSILAIGQAAGRDALEVENGLDILEGTSGTFDLLVGIGSAREETIQIDSVAIKGRAATTIAADPALGAITIEVTSLVPHVSAEGGTFPPEGGYRIVINEGLSTREVAYVIAARTEGGPTYFFDLEEPLTIDHPNGATVDLMADVLETNVPLTKSHTGYTALSNRSTVQGGVNAYYSLQDTTSNPELAQVLIGSITLVSGTGLDTDGGDVIFNFGNGTLPVEAVIDAGVSAGDTTISVASSDAFPSPTSRFVAIIGVGTPAEEKVLVNANNTGTDVFTLGDGTHGVQYAHAIGEIVRFEPGLQEDVEFSEVDTNILRFDPEIVLQYTHYPVETVIDSSATSDPADNGYDFPFRMPIDILVRLQYLLDIVRAAGIQVELITQR
jgi:hypothetical protein